MKTIIRELLLSLLKANSCAEYRFNFDKHDVIDGELIELDSGHCLLWNEDTNGSGWCSAGLKGE